MATKNPPVKNAAFTFRIVLFAQSDNQIKTTPTIAAGDFKVSTDGGALANPGTLPSESPASSGQVLITLTADEMNGDEIVVRWIDASGAEWHSGAVVLHTIASGQQFDQLATATALATVDTVVDSILDDTGTSGVALAAGSITSTVIAANAIGATQIATSAITATKIATDAIGAAELAADAIAEIADAIWDEAIAGHVAAGSFGEETQAHLTISEATGLYNLLAANITTVLSRIGSFAGSGVNNILGFLRAIVRSDATLPSDVGGTYDPATDSLEANAGTGATAEAIADAVWDELLAGHATAGSAGATLAAVDPDAIVDALEAALAAVSSVTVVSTVAGATATVYQYATWDATFTLSGSPGLTAYENLIFAVKRYPSDTDAESVLLVKSSGGLIYIGQAAATASSYGTLTADSATEFTVYVDVAEVAAKIAANFSGGMTWTLKGIETGTTPDEAIVIATGSWYIEPGFVRTYA